MAVNKKARAQQKAREITHALRAAHSTTEVKPPVARKTHIKQIKPPRVQTD